MSQGPTCIAVLSISGSKMNVTRTYLAEVWADLSVAFLIGGGNEGVSAVLIDVQEAGFPNVFGVIDRDFRQSNRPDWFTAGKSFRRFILPAHEIENYLLDASALSISRLNNLKSTPQEIDEMMRTAAGRLCWWTACREVVAELSNAVSRNRQTQSFRRSIPREAAQHHICDSEWFRKLGQEIVRSTIEDIHRELANAHGAAVQSLADGRWRIEFAGKEIFRDVGSRICDRTQLANRNPSSADFDQDLAQEIASWQKRNGAVPADVADLLRALKLRMTRRAP